MRSPTYHALSARRNMRGKSISNQVLDPKTTVNELPAPTDGPSDKTLYESKALSPAQKKQLDARLGKTDEELEQVRWEYPEDEDDDEE